jgi:hypothetical protein
MGVGSMFQGSSRGLTRLAFWSAVLVAGVVAVAAVIFTAAYAVGGPDATADNWVGVVGVLGLFGGLAWSLVSFVLAVGARMREGSSGSLWLPFLLFPALLAFLVLGEAVWWE